MQNIGEKVRNERRNKSIKQKELAMMAGISNTYLSDIEVSRTTPSIKTLMKLAEALGIDCEVLLRNK